MRLSRRHFIGSMLAAGVVPAAEATASTERELVPILASEALEVPYKFRRQEVKYQTAEPPGTIVVDPKKRWLYHVQAGGKSIRYGVGVGEDGKNWSGEAIIKRKVKWPQWRPTKEHLAVYPTLAKYRDEAMPGGPGNPLGARALYLFQGDVDTLYRIHGTIKPKGIGREVTSGCIRMLNVDVVHLYDQVEIGTRVVVLSY
jgi:lipoprotein-anchoring transpeptidase ErfK/SrfK